MTDLPATTESEAREPVSKPEDHRAALVDSAPAVAANDQEVPLADFHFVEEHLAEHIHSRLSPEMAKDMTLTLVARPRLGKTDLILQFKGPALEVNGALMADKVMTMLKEHAECQKLFSRKPEGPFERQPEGHADTLEVIVPQMELAEYVGLIGALKQHAHTKQAETQQAKKETPEAAKIEPEIIAEHAPEAAKKDTPAPESPKVEAPAAANDNPPSTTVQNAQHDQMMMQETPTVEKAAAR